MKIIVVGASGTIGREVVSALQGRHEVIGVGRTSGRYQVDMRDSGSIRALFEKTGRFDALVVCAGSVHFGDLAALGEKEVMVGVHDKLMGQVNLVLLGKDHVADEGSFTLTSGVLSHDPIPRGACASLVNGAIESFVRAAAIELRRGLRINAISPALLDESVEAFGDYFPGHETVPGKRVARAYVKSVEGRLTGQVLPVL